MSIDLNISSDQHQVIDAVRGVLEARLPLARFQAKRSSGVENEMLPELAKLGWLGLGLEERYGGAGFTLVEDALLFRELGRHLATPSLLAGAIAARLAIACGEADLSNSILEGRACVCLANAVEAIGSDRRDGARECLLYDAEGAQLALVFGSSSLELLPIDAFPPSQPRKCVDRTVTLRRISTTHVQSPAALSSNDRELLNYAGLMVSAQMWGIAEAALDLCVAYAKTCRQFGQLIGAFQAIKHRCADMKVRASVLRAQVSLAALAEKELQGDAALQIAAARLLTGRYAIENAAAGIQIHGAMGFTAECDAHLFLLRAHLLENLGSNARRREEELNDLSLPDFA